MFYTKHVLNKALVFNLIFELLSYMSLVIELKKIYSPQRGSSEKHITITNKVR